MAIIKAFRSVFHSRPTDTYRLTIYDLAGDDTASNNNALYGYDASATTDPVDIDVAFDSLVQTWDGAIDTIHTPIIGSRLEMGLHLTNDTYYLLDLIKARKEGEIAVKLERHDGGDTDITTEARYDDIFIGCLSPEAVTYPFQNPPFELSLVFTDGLSLLRDFAYEQDDGTPWTDDATYEHFRTQIGRCLSKLPHLALYDQTVNAPFFIEQLDAYHFNHVSTALSIPYSVLDKSGCNQNVWYDTRLHDNPFNRKQKIVTGGSTCYEVIQDIMTALGGTFLVHNGSFWAVSPFMKDDNSVTNSQRAWKSDYRTLTDPSYQDSGATGYSGGDANVNRIDYTSADILLGSSRSFLNPAKSVMYTHAKGGAPYIFKEKLPVTAYGDTFAQNIFYPAPFDIDPTTPSYDSGFGGYGSIVEEEGKSFPLKNDDYTFVGGQELLIKARVVLDIGDGLTASDDAFVSAQPTIKMKIKVGDKYLKQTVAIAPSSDFTLVNNFGRVHIAVGNPMDPVGTDQTGWRPLEITSDVEWTDTVGDRFEFPFLIEGQNDPEIDTIEYTDGEDIKSFPVGLQCVRHDSHASRMRFRWSDRKKEHDLIINMVLPPLPGSASDTYTGIEIDVESKVWRNTDGAGTMQSVDFDNALVPYDSLRFHNLRVLAGEDVDDEDILYVAASDSEKGFEHVDGGSTLLGSRLDGYYGDVGMMKANEPGHITDSTEVDGYGEYWFSEAESGRDPSSADGRPSMEVIAHEHLAIRQELREVYNISLLAEDHHKKAIWPLRRVKIETGTTDAVVQVMTCSHQFSSGQYSFVGFEIARAGSGITDTTSDAAKQVNRKRPSRLPGPRPASKSASVAGITNAVQDKLDAISYTGTGISGFNFGTNTNVVPAEQVETDQDRQFMSQVQKDQHLDNTEAVSRIVRDSGTGDITSFTVHTGSKPLNANDIDDSAAGNKFATQSQLDAIDALPSNILRKDAGTHIVSDGTDNFFATESGANGRRISNIYLYAADDTASNITGLSLWTLKTAIAHGQTSTNKAYVSTLKVLQQGSTTATENADVYTIHHLLAGNLSQCPAAYSYACGALVAGSRLPDPDADRSGQTGDKVVVIGDDGNYDEIADGTKSQVLSTSGAGVLSFQSIKYPLVAMSGRVTTTAANNYYYGSSSFGWNYPIWSSISFNNTAGNPYARNVLDDYAHCGIVMPMRLQNLRVYGTVRNDSGTENIRLFLGKVSPPNGSSSNMVLTELGTQDITVSTQDRHYDVDFTTTGSVPAGELIFVGIGRASTSTGTRYINFSLSIQGTL